MKQSQTTSGIIFVAITYVIWGVFPLYWKLLDHVSSVEILLNRVIWSFILTLLFLFVIGKRKQLIQDISYLWKNQQQFWSLAGASFVITLNWFVYIWAVNNDHVLQTSLGYYINPLITVLFGVLFFKEKLNRATMIAVIIAGIGVAALTIYYQELPIVSLILAFSFATYSVLKKKITIEATRGLAIETSFMLPIALISYIVFMQSNDVRLLADLQTTTLLVLCGAVTAVPLILFAKGARKIPLYLVGFIQYLSPTIVLILGIFLYNEPFTSIELFAFCCIWFAVLLFSVSKMLEARKNRRFEQG